MMTMPWQSERCKCHVLSLQMSHWESFDYPREVNSFSINLRIANIFRNNTKDVLRAAWSGERRCARTSCARGKNCGYAPILVLVLVAISDEYFLGHIFARKFCILSRYCENSLLWRREIKKKYTPLPSRVVRRRTKKIVTS